MKEQCQRTVDRLTPFVDEALPPAEQVEVAQHLEACPPCRVSAVKEEGGKTLLRQRAARLRAAPLPPGLRTRCAVIAREHAHGATPASWRARVVPATIGAALVMATAMLLLMLATERSNTVLAAQLTADHSACFLTFRPPAGGMDADAAESRLSSLGWDLHVPASSAGDGVQLLDARGCLYGEGRMPHLLYDVDGQHVSLFVLEGETREPADITSFGLRSRIWSRGASTFVLVSPAAAGDLSEAFDYLRQEAR